MCGIAGKIYSDRSRPVWREELLEMGRMLTHRGPDGEGVWTSGHVGFAHRRLAVIDLRPEANQPMCNEAGTIWITYNGEIYNFRELRDELRSKGYRFRTNSDTEVIIHAYEAYGKECLGRLRGMFAFVIWDTRAETLFVARDRIGKKPLFYYAGPDRFLFASEIKALLVDRSLAAAPNAVAIDHFLALQYVPAPHTAFEGIKKLPAAHWLEWRDGHIRTGRYWHLRYSPKKTITFNEAVEQLRWHLKEAVGLRLVSDVPLGALLSGGVDSSAVVAYASQEANEPFRTFSVGFEDEAHDERPYARSVAERFRTQHTELLVKPALADVLPRLVWHYDEPFGDASALPSYAIAELTRQSVKVVLNGDGADESFAGYDRYVTHRWVGWGDRIPYSWRQRLYRWSRKIPEGIASLSSFRNPLKLIEFLSDPAERRYARWVGHFGKLERQGLYSRDFKCLVSESDPEALFESFFQDDNIPDLTDAALAADVHLYLVDDLLVKMDRATMAHSLEARSPFLDHVLMEFMAALPVQYKLSGVSKKHLLRAALRGIIPDVILNRPKMGFSVPLNAWLRGDLRELAHDTLLSDRSLQRGYFDPTAIQKLLEDHSSGRTHHGERLWDLLMLELWHRTFIDTNSQMAVNPTIVAGVL